LQRKGGKFGAGLGKTTGWIHRTTLKMRNVTQIGSCNYLEVNDEGLVIETKGAKKTLPVDTVVICAGQVSDVSLHKSFASSSSSKQPKLFLIGGSQEAGELDAKRAIDQGTRSTFLFYLAFV
jgi:2,4-dienoyl-CoA reductase (NADPH2)